VPLKPVIVALIAMCWAANHAAASDAQTEELVIISQPLNALQASGTASTQVFTQDDLAALPYDRLDAALASQSSFGLFRRTPSIAANPTIQGATLRGIGPNGAGRAAVLLDGAPLNDPFGNWVNWSAIPVSSVNQVILERGGRPLSGGSGALSGIVALETGQQREGTRMALSGTTLEGFDAVMTHAGSIGKADVIASASGGQRDGYSLLPQRQRGPADVPTASYNAAASIKIGLDLAGSWRTALQLRGFTEGRDNGLEGAVNSTDGFDGSLRLTRPAAQNQLGVDLLVYGQVREFENLFTAVDAARETTRPVLDQFSVPAYAAGMRGQIEHQWSASSQTTVFLQVDHKSGETREAFRNFGAGFTRERRAGGQQMLYGAGMLHSQSIAERLALEIGLRLDGTRLSSGKRVETDRQSGAVLREDIFEARSAAEPGAEIGLKWTPLAAWQVHARGYTGYRMPSLNEFFRPFRVGNDITEANPMLRNETLTGIDIGARFEPLSGQFIDVTVFYNWLEDAVGNITIPGADGGVIAPCGFVPTGGSCRQRGNIDRIGIFGTEVQSEVRLSKTLRLTAFYGYTDASVMRDDGAPAVAGNRLAQVPRHQGSISALWQPIAWPLRASFTLRGQSRQFEDDLNQRALKGFAALDASAQWQVRRGIAVRADIVNITDQEIQAGRTANGLISRAQPLTASLGIQIEF
jgi:outer membrane receptor protein involved in Fe transport